MTATRAMLSLALFLLRLVSLASGAADDSEELRLAIGKLSEETGAVLARFKEANLRSTPLAQLAVRESTEASGESAEEPSELTEEPSKGKVLVLDDENFDAEVRRHEFLLVEFYAPWCGHCKKLDPEWTAAAQALAAANSTARLGKLDATASKATAARFEISGFPMIYLFRSGVRLVYDGDRTAEAVVAWARRRTGESSVAEEESEEERAAAQAGVLVLTEASFEAEVGRHPFLLVQFYAPWCGFCKKLAPDWTRAARALNASGSVARLAQIDATLATSVASKVKGFPLILLFRLGAHEEYDGGRSESEILRWIEKRSGGPAAKELGSVSELLAMRAAHDLLVLGCFSDRASLASRVFLEVARNDSSREYGVAYSDEVRAHLSIAAETVVVLDAKDGVRGSMVVDGSDAAAVLAFVETSSAPLVHLLDEHNARRILTSSQRLQMLFFTDRANAHHAPLLRRMASVAEQLRGRLMVVNVPVTEKKLLDVFGFTAETLPRMVVIDMRKAGAPMLRLPFAGDLASVEAILAHASLAIAGPAVDRSVVAGSGLCAEDGAEDTCGAEVPS